MGERSSGGSLRFLIEIPRFQDPLDDQRAFLDTKASASLYLRLACKLGSHRLSRIVDRRIDYLDAAVSSLAESRRHAQIFAAEITLEALIVALLVIDLGFRVFELWREK